MSLKTRLDGRSENNSSFQVKNKEGVSVATISYDGNDSITLVVSTASDLHIEKPSGWSSEEHTKQEDL